MPTNATEFLNANQGDLLLAMARFEAECVKLGMPAESARQCSEGLYPLLVQIQNQATNTAAELTWKTSAAVTRACMDVATKIALAYGSTGHAKECAGAHKVAETLQRAVDENETDMQRVARGETTFLELVLEDI